MASIDQLKDQIDLHDLAEKLGMKRGKGDKGNYHSPSHPDKSPSLSIFKGGRAWKDHSTDGAGGTCIDLVIYAGKAGDVGEAVKFLHDLYGIPFDPKPQSDEPRRERTRAEFIAEKCIEEADKAMSYLVDQRGILELVAKAAIAKRMVGFNTWTSPSVKEGEPGHGGPAAAFIVRTMNPGHVVAVDLRYLDPVLNGNVKTQCQGEKHGYGWFIDLKKLQAAHTVYIVESPINALSIECCGMGGVAAFATRGTGNVQNIPWQWLKGKQVIICMDNDAPFPEGHPKAGTRPGLSAAWELHERLTALDISALMVDQAEWEHNDVNDILKAGGVHELKVAMRKLDQWLIPGMPGEYTEGAGKPRIYMPSHHWWRYSHYRVKPDFTSSYKEESEKDDAGNVTKKPVYADLAGFRIAGISRVSIASATSTMTGEQDVSPRVMFAVSVQVARHGPKLQRKVVDDEKLHNLDTWKRFGPVFSQGPFLRMVNILENAAHLGAREAANFVGLCWRGGRLIVNEGPDCYFMHPDQQCPYHNLTFPTGGKADARRVVQAYLETFRGGQAAMLLAWALGGHLKAILGFWPHLQLQADKGAGKSTLIKRLERSIGFTMFSGQSLQTEFRLLTSISHTSHPVGWEELSARRQDVIDKAVGLLQENYQHTVTRRGSEMTEYLLTAPVLLAGEDVPVDSLIGKLVRVDLKVADQGPQIAEDVPRFPVRQWLEWLAELTPSTVRSGYEQLRQHCLERSRASGQDAGASRMAGNYAAVLQAWRLLCEFADMDPREGELGHSLLATMNTHIADTSGDRQPWVWIVQTLLAEIARGNYAAPFCWSQVEEDDCLLIRTSDVMHHIKSTPALRDFWNGLPVKSDRVFKKQMASAGVIVKDTIERTLHNRRISHMTALSLAKMDEYGLHATPTIPDANPHS